MLIPPPRRAAGAPDNNAPTHHRQPRPRPDTAAGPSRRTRAKRQENEHVEQQQPPSESSVAPPTPAGAPPPEPTTLRPAADAQQPAPSAGANAAGIQAFTYTGEGASSNNTPLPPAASPSNGGAAADGAPSAGGAGGNGASPSSPSEPPGGEGISNSTPLGPSAGVSGGANVSNVFTATDNSHNSSTLSFTRTMPWTYSPSPPTRTTSGKGASQTTFVPGHVFNLTLGGSTDASAIYSLPMSFGHYSASSRKRGPDWDGVSPQVINMQIDLGSSDMWVAADTCNTLNCKSASVLYNSSQSMDTETNIGLNYQTGSVAGNVFWEQVTLGTFSIGWQAFVAATTVYNEDLGGGNFEGLIGLAFPQNSVILSKIPAGTSSQPDGATFLDNLFGSGASAPSQRFFSLSLERREDVRTSSTFGIGALSTTACPGNCAPNYVQVIPAPNLGRTGFLHWRVQMDRITATKFADPKAGTGATTTNVTLGPSQVDSTRRTPLAIVDSGGLATLVGNKAFADNIYAPFGVKASGDGLYRMPCNVPITLTVTIGGFDYPIHPLDMSYVDPSDPTQSTCIGAVQVAPLANNADFVLGSSFLKNVYSVFQYPDASKGGWQPNVGFVSLTNPSVASQDFYAVRNMRQSLGDVSSGHGGNSPPSPGSGSPAAQHRVVSTAIIAACSVVGFFVLAAAAFCAWWFWLRRKLGATGVVEYKMANLNGGSSPSDPGISTVRSRKHEATNRQKSMVEGYSDYDMESWRSTTNSAEDSIRLSMPRVTEEFGDRHLADGLSNHTRGSSIHQSLLLADHGPPASSPTSDITPGIDRPRRESSRLSVQLSPAATGRLIDLPSSPPPQHTSPRPSFVNMPKSPSQRSTATLSMSGPFPTSTRPTSMQASSSAEYEYFSMLPVPTPEDREQNQQHQHTRTPLSTSSLHRMSTP
ncbi:hypothetical protein VHUM_03121 [Vanrija humicola]|uniref:Peptidase A1 domain-containing protein n=1 Tax=Vanrija humicola TaxID=5417 RepID=A0A7D8YYC2_VANHU|nr:hypothetical protein VHUM_03121 [Vanrija humicola]